MSNLEIFQTHEHDDQDFSDLNLPHADLVGHVFDHCIFTRCNLSGANFTQSRLMSCKFVSCDLSNVMIKNSRIRDTNFLLCKLIGVQSRPSLNIYLEWFSAYQALCHSKVFSYFFLSYCHFLCHTSGFSGHSIGNV